VKQVSSAFNAETVRNMLPKLDWAALQKTAAEVSVARLCIPGRPGSEVSGNLLLAVIIL
jgi:hypothetical protein